MAVFLSPEDSVYRLVGIVADIMAWFDAGWELIWAEHRQVFAEPLHIYRASLISGVKVVYFNLNQRAPVKCFCVLFEARGTTAKNHICSGK